VIPRHCTINSAVNGVGHSPGDVIKTTYIITIRCRPLHSSIHKLRPGNGRGNAARSHFFCRTLEGRSKHFLLGILIQPL
jgi:hypothetical protein